MQARYTRVDYARGVAMLLVVLGHVGGGLAAQSHTDAGTAEFIHTLHVRNSFRMPMLFLIAGIFAERSLRKGVGKFFGDRAGYLVWPYLVWNVVMIGTLWVAAAISERIGRPLANTPAKPASELLEMFINPIGFWFLHTLFCSLALYAGLRLLRIRIRYIAVIGAVLYFCSAAGWFEFWPALSKVGRFFVFLAMGAAFGDYLLTMGQRWHWRRALLGFVVFGGIMAWFVQLTPSGPNVQFDHFGRPIYPSDAFWAKIFDLPLAIGVSMFGMAALWMLALVCEKLHQPKFVKAWGRISLEIFLLSPFACVGARIILQEVFDVTSVPVLLVLCTAAGMFVPMLAVYITDKLGWNYVFRFGRPSRLSRTRPIASSGQPPMGTPAVS